MEHIRCPVAAKTCALATAAGLSFGFLLASNSGFCFDFTEKGREQEGERERQRQATPTPCIDLTFGISTSLYYMQYLTLPGVTSTLSGVSAFNDPAAAASLGTTRAATWTARPPRTSVAGEINICSSSSRPFGSTAKGEREGGQSFGYGLIGNGLAACEQKK